MVSVVSQLGPRPESSPTAELLIGPRDPAKEPALSSTRDDGVDVRPVPSLRSSSRLPGTWRPMPGAGNSEGWKRDPSTTSISANPREPSNSSYPRSRMASVRPVAGIAFADSVRGRRRSCHCKRLRSRIASEVELHSLRRPVRRCDSDGRAMLHRREWGTGQPVIAMHPLGLESSAFEGFGTVLARYGLRTIAVDLPGSGRTPMPKQPLTPAVMAKPVIELARSLDERPIVVGISMGGRRGRSSGRRSATTAASSCASPRSSGGRRGT